MLKIPFLGLENIHSLLHAGTALSACMHAYIFTQYTFIQNSFQSYKRAQFVQAGFFAVSFSTHCKAVSWSFSGC